MTERRKAKLIGAVKLCSDVDGIGVAVFSAENALLVPKMDGDFNLVDFVDFYNEQDFDIRYDLPKEYQQREVAVGDPSPVPFWKDNICSIVDGDAEKAQIERMFGIEARTNPVLRDLGRMLDDARNGRINEQIKRWEAADIAAGFDDVFLGPPSRTRYWITRYRVALQNARKLTNPPHPIDVRLRKAANDWLHKFAPKAEPAMLGSILGNSAHGIFSSTQIKNILFAYIVHKLIHGSVRDLDVILREDTAATVFPAGLYRYFVDSGWPHVPFKYSHGDLLELLKAEISSGVERRNFDAAVKLSILIFGAGDAPQSILDFVEALMPKMMDDFYRAQAMIEDERIRPYAHIVPGMDRLAKRVLRAFKPVEQLSRVIFGVDRTAGHLMDRRYGIRSEQIEEWRRWIDGAN